MNDWVKNRLEAIQQTLLAHYQAGQKLPSPVAGSERELFVHEYLAKVLPPTLRIGKECITDAANNQSGQVDVVIEYPFVPSFPMPTTADRLYLAESVAAAIEVKSDLTKQWDEVAATVKKVKVLRRDLRQPNLISVTSSPNPVFQPDQSRVYCYAVGYRGHQTLEGLAQRLNTTPDDERPDGVLVVESGCFTGNIGQASGGWGFFAFLAELTTITNAIMGIANPLMTHYGEIGELKK